MSKATFEGEFEKVRFRGELVSNLRRLLSSSSRPFFPPCDFIVIHSSRYEIFLFRSVDIFRREEEIGEQRFDAVVSARRDDKMRKLSAL